MLNGITFILLNVLSIKMLNLFFDFKIIHFVLFIFLPNFFSPNIYFWHFCQRREDRKRSGGEIGKGPQDGI